MFAVYVQKCSVCFFDIYYFSDVPFHFFFGVGFQNLGAVKRKTDSSLKKGLVPVSLQVLSLGTRNTFQAKYMYTYSPISRENPKRRAGFPRPAHTCPWLFTHVSGLAGCQSAKGLVPTASQALGEVWPRQTSPL